jgi:hypothetical protein
MWWDVFFLHCATRKYLFFSTNRFSLVKVVAMMWKEMSCLDWFMFQEKNGQATTITRRLVL